MLQVLYSNRYETLVEALCEDLSTMPADPWASEEVVVPSAAARRHIELELAKRRGICANVNFGYLAQWLWARIGGVLEVPAHSPLAVERLQWRCYRLFSERGREEAGLAGAGGGYASPRLAAYLDAADAPMRYELARRVATLFDHYLTYRPEWLARWQAGGSIFDEPQRAGVRPGSGPQLREDERWQAALWRAVLAELAGGDDALAAVAPPAHRFLDVARGLDLDAVMRARWPASVSVFALPTIAPLHIALLRELSHWMDVRLYVMNPCRQFWFDIVSVRAAVALDAAGSLDYHEVGHPLLAEWGRQTQAQLHLVHELTEGAASAEATRFMENPAPGWLAKLQNAMLDLETEEPEPALGEQGGARASQTVEVHVCHSLSRQLEVLHDRLLGWFDDGAREDGAGGLRPSDVLVVCPDLAAAAPLVDAVFGTMEIDDRRRIPYRVTGLPASQANPVARVLLQWLALGERGATAPELVEWLRIDAVAARYGIDAGALDAAQAWLAAAGARRGLAPSASGGEQAPLARHTFSDALTRLFLGYAMPDGGEPVDAWLPVPGAQGAESELLGRLARFVDDLERFAGGLGEPRAGEAWARVLGDALEQFFDEGPAFSDAVGAVRDALDSTLDTLRDGAGEMPVPVDVLRAALTAALDDSAKGGVPWGGVTFSSLTSLRGLPYRAICLIGMDEGALPSLARPDEFDLMAACPLLGDRQRRADERNLFLDLLLAARDRFFVAYTGRSIRDNAPLPPAALVDELLDHLARAAAGPGAAPSQVDAARRAFIVEHPLQPFSSAYFEAQSGLFTYDAERAQLAERLTAGEPARARPFFAQPLPPEPDGPIAFADFVRFWQHPARAQLRERLGIVLESADGELIDTEPFALDYAASDALAERILPRLVEDGGEAVRARAMRVADASPELPIGATGGVMKRRELAALQRLAADVRADAAGARARRLTFALAVRPAWPDTGGAALFGVHDAALAQAVQAAPARELQGALGGLTDNGLVLYRYARAGARDYLGAWLAHLVYCAAEPDGPRRTVWHGRDERFEFAPVAAPLDLLAPLLALFLAGRRAPLPFFPRSAWAKAKSGDAEALGTWISDRVRGESEDPALAIAWRGLPLALDERFAAVSRFVFDPLIAHLSGEDA
ncbi:exodeoxyribonuclease V subunit gamma [Trinickia caryophylli]|uniref:RecBCD enzyme subunit RecC n=1 Tax=Trinickia caryophylli TaxID=28094 RepID=A0A1X7DY86_TRICW|nr:exodeoxyribonuclease V subunit gamma [Trinickia caryophylli]PMS14161.1 exodeoxyribonuclease V subunit gamma [Trinickia caryophylli]TRX17857.1 exodeoxyribonuclease V subunit gamma [Trinickia caryophylli]WQE11374.1 exodeoxyribonuclease V subunit gamma [Trinickia caryophylli]SMF23747.1 DNA helicase/exodeoxyribonuclease V, gamma subunit [Trinickia caryophylli]GLU32532.1 RecBCD enzyme subunit RecC [Trinickia caryophylli]